MNDERSTVQRDSGVEALGRKLSPRGVIDDFRARLIQEPGRSSCASRAGTTEMASISAYPPTVSRAVGWGGGSVVKRGRQKDLGTAR